MHLKRKCLNRETDAYNGSVMKICAVPGFFFFLNKYFVCVFGDGDRFRIRVGIYVIFERFCIELGLGILA